MMQVLFNFQELEVNKNNLEMHLWKEKMCIWLHVLTQVLKEFLSIF